MAETFNRMKESFILWKLAFFRAFLYSMVPFLTTLLSQTETWSDKTFVETGPFTKIRIFIIAISASIPSVLAFLDSTIARIKKDVLVNDPDFPTPDTPGSDTSLLKKV